MPLLLQRVGDVLRHIVLVVLGKHSVRPENAGWIERAFGDHALPFAKQIRKNSLVGNRQGRAVVSDQEADRKIVAAHQRPPLYEAAETEPLAGWNVLFGYRRRRREKYN